MAKPSSSGRRSWKETTVARRRSSPGSKLFARWTLTLVALGLIAALGVVIIPSCGPRTYIVALPVVDYDRLVVPPLAYVTEDHRELADTPNHGFDTWPVLETSQSISHLSDRLDALAARDRDVLILYFHAHGISQGGTPWLLCSDYLRRPNSGLADVGQILDQIKRCRAGTKLVILDAGRLPLDPAQGMLLNEFPWLVEKQVRDVVDPNLWVILPSTTFQTSAVDHSRRRGLLADAIATGLRGEANRDGNQDVTLSELFTFVAARSEDWFESSAATAQTPLLFQGGVGLVDPARLTPDPFLVSLNWKWRKQEPGEKQGEEKKEGGESSPPATQSANRESRGNFAGRQAIASAMRFGSGATRGPGVFSWLQTAAPSPVPAADSAAPPATDAAPATTEPAPSTAAPPAATEPPAAAAPTTTAPATAPAPSPAPAPETPPGNSATIGGPPAADDFGPQLRTALAQAWQWRDRLQSRTDPAWSPVDFAPHLWRELNASILDYEFRCRSGAAPTTGPAGAKLATDLNNLVTGLSRLYGFLADPSRSPPARRAEQTLIEDRLIEAWRRFREFPDIKQSWDEVAPELAETRQALAVSADLAFWAPCYVAWHDRTSLAAGTSAGTDVTYATLVELLSGLDRFQDRLNTYRRDGTLDAAAKYDLKEMVSRLSQMRQALDGTLHRDAEAAVRGLQKMVNQRQIEDLLATPLLPGPQRKMLLDELLKPGRLPPARGESPRPGTPRSLFADPGAWQRQLERIQIWQHLVNLVDPQQAAQLHQQIDLVRQLTPPPAGDETRVLQVLQAYRRMGASLQQVFAAAPRNVNPSASSNLGSDTEILSRIAWGRMIDPRDVRKVDDRADLWFAFPFKPVDTTIPQVELTGPEEAALDLAAWRPLPLSIRWTGKEPLVVEASLQYDPALVQLRAAEGEKTQVPDSPGQKFRFTLPAGQATTLSLQTLARLDRQQAQGRPAPLLKFEMHTPDGRMLFHTVRGELPYPNQVDLVVRRVVSTSSQGDVNGRLRLRPYPNRETAYRFSLVNRSGQGKKVEVELWAARRPLGATWAPGRLYVAGGNLYRGLYQELFDPVDDTRLPQVRVVATAKDVMLPARGDELVEVKIPFADSSAPPAGVPPAAAGAEPAAPPPPPPAPEVTDGLVCVIRNLEDPKERWEKWIELVPATPRHYFEPSVVYDYARGQIVARLKPSTTDIEGNPESDPKRVLPTGIREKPMQIVWDTGGELPAGTAKNDRVEFDGSAAEVVLWAAVKPDGASRVVRLSVDDYPRAFVYIVPCAENGTGTSLNWSYIRLKSLRVPDYARIFQYLAPPGPPPPPSNPPVEIVPMKQGEVAAFPAPRDYIQVQFEVDAPDDYFQKPLEDQRDVIEVGLSTAFRKPTPLYSDRQMTAHLSKTGPDGLVILRTQVGDHTLQVKTDGLQNEKVLLQADLILNNAKKAEDPVGIWLDGTPPEVSDLLTRPENGKILHGTKFIAQVYALDKHAGLEKVELGIDKNKNGQFDEGDAVDVAQFVGENLWELTIDTKMLEEERDYQVLARATDKVGHQTTSKGVLVRFNSPMPMTEPKKEKLLIRGLVKNLEGFGGDVRITVMILELPDQVVKTDTAGNFEFPPDIPEGSYTLIAKGLVANTIREGKLEGVKPSPVSAPKTVLLPVKRPEPE